MTPPAGWANPFLAAYGHSCAHCGISRECTGGAKAVGGVHVCPKAIEHWLAVEPDSSHLELLDLQWRGG